MNYWQIAATTQAAAGGLMLASMAVRYMKLMSGGILGPTTTFDKLLYWVHRQAFNLLVGVGVGVVAFDVYQLVRGF